MRPFCPADMTWGIPMELGVSGDMTLQGSRTPQGLCDASSTFFLLKPQTCPAFCHSLHHVKREEALEMVKASVQKMPKLQGSAATLQCVVGEESYQVEERSLTCIGTKHWFSVLTVCGG